MFFCLLVFLFFLFCSVCFGVRIRRGRIIYDLVEAVLF